MKAVKNRELGNRWRIEWRMHPCQITTDKSQERRRLAAVKSKLNHLTHSSRMEFPTIINGTSLFPFQGLLGGSIYFLFKFNKTFCT